MRHSSQAKLQALYCSLYGDVPHEAKEDTPRQENKAISHRLWQGFSRFSGIYVVACGGNEIRIMYFECSAAATRQYICILPIVRITPFLSLLGSTSIYFVDKSRRGEVSYFVFVRSLRSLYIFLKKRFNFPLENEKTICFVMIFGIVSYLYYEGPKDLKNRNLLDSLWGEA